MLSFLCNAKIASKCVCILYSINALAEFVKKQFSGLDVYANAATARALLPNVPKGSPGVK